jgi:mannose-6-phosphate isomerase-like protein (cupin superfamily)
MLFPSIWVDEHGHSYLGEVDLPQSGNERRVGAAPQDVKYWRAAKYLPGHFSDFTTVEDVQFYCVMSGRMELTVSNGEKRYLSRGDMILLRDTTGQGHCTRVLGHEECNVLIIAMPDTGDFVL